MPTNLPPQYFEIEKRYRTSSNNAEKLAALEEMLRMMPKHKGTDHLQAEVKSKIAKLRQDSTKKPATKLSSMMVPKQGAVQIALVGPANSGKSSLLVSLTRARPEVADYPHTTQKPTPGMMDHGGAGFQLVDLPPLSYDYNDAWLFDQIRRADLIWVVVAADSPLSGLETVQAVLGDRKIGIYPALRQLDGDMEMGWYYKETLLVATGGDQDYAGENMAIFQELTEVNWPFVVVSNLDQIGMDELGQATFEALEIMRIFTKQPDKEPDMADPFILPSGGTVDDLAARIHKDVQSRLQSARVWGSGVFDGRVVQREHVLEDGDIVELKI